MAEPLQVPLEKLRELYVVQGLSSYSIAKFHNIGSNSINTINKWILQHQLANERNAYQKQVAEMAQQQSSEVIEGDFVIQNENNIAGEAQANEVSGNQPGLPALIDDEEDNSAFGRLSRYKQKFVLVYADNQNKLNHTQIAELLNIDGNTVSNNLKDPDVREAILDVVRADFKFKGELSLLNRIQQLEDEHKDRPDDRKLKADILGLINNNKNININLGYGGPTDKRIKGF